MDLVALDMNSAPLARLSWGAPIAGPVLHWGPQASHMSFVSCEVARKHDIITMTIGVMECAAPSPCCKSPRLGPTVGNVPKEETMTMVSPMTLKESLQIRNNRLSILVTVSRDI